MPTPGNEIKHLSACAEMLLWAPLALTRPKRSTHAVVQFVEAQAQASTVPRHETFTALHVT
eukprot:230408-Amphidinium_carterae.1